MKLVFTASSGARYEIDEDAWRFLRLRAAFEIGVCGRRDLVNVFDPFGVMNWAKDNAVLKVDPRKMNMGLLKGEVWDDMDVGSLEPMFMVPEGIEGDSRAGIQWAGEEIKVANALLRLGEAGLFHHDEHDPAMWLASFLHDSGGVRVALE